MVDDAIQNFMGKSAWSESVVLSRFDDVFVMVHHRLKFLFDCVGDFGGESNIQV